MNSTKNLRIVFVILLLAFLSTALVEAARRPFTAPPGTQVAYTSTGRDYSVWTINAPDYSAIAVVGKIKLPRQYWRGKAFQRYVNSYFKQDQTWASYGINVKARWKNGAYVVEGTSGNYRVYAKGRISKGYWSQGWVVGQNGAAKTKALERMIKALR